MLPHSHHKGKTRRLLKVIIDSLHLDSVQHFPAFSDEHRITTALSDGAECLQAIVGAQVGDIPRQDSYLSELVLQGQRLAC